MPHYPRGLLIIALSLYLTAIALGLMVSTIMSAYYVPRLFLLGIGNVTIKKGESISIFTSWVPINLAYSLDAMGVIAVPEVIVPSIVNGTPAVVRGIEPSLINYYGINATAGELDRGVLVGYELAKGLNIGVGDRLLLTSFKGINESTIVVGIIKSVRYPQLNYEVITNMTTAQHLDGLPSPIVNVIYVNASYQLVSRINGAYELRVITHVVNGSLAIFDASNHTVFSGPLMNVTLTLPFGAYYVVVYNGSRITWFSMVMLRGNQTINVAITHVLTINITHLAPSEWVIVKWPNGSLVSGYYLLIYGENGSLVYSAVGSGAAPISLPSGEYRLVVISGPVYYSVSAYVMPHLNVTVTLPPYTIIMGELTTHAYNYIVKVAPLGPGAGPAALISVIRVGIGTFIGLAVGLLVIASIGLIGITEYSIAVNRELITYLRLNRAGGLNMALLIDLPIIITYMASTALGLFTANYLWPIMVRAVNLSVLNQPLYLVTMSNAHPYVVAFTVMSMLLIIMHVVVRFRVMRVD